MWSHFYTDCLFYGVLGALFKTIGDHGMDGVRRATQELTRYKNSIDDINKSCLEQFRAHWNCLEMQNHQLWQCRPAEWKLNKCVYENIVCPLLLHAAGDVI